MTSLPLSLTKLSEESPLWSPHHCRDERGTSGAGECAQQLPRTLKSLTATRPEPPAPRSRPQACPVQQTPMTSTSSHSSPCKDTGGYSSHHMHPRAHTRALTAPRLQGSFHNPQTPASPGGKDAKPLHCRWRARWGHFLESQTAVLTESPLAPVTLTRPARGLPQAHWRLRQKGPCNMATRPGPEGC